MSLVILCLYNSHVSKQVLPPLGSRKNGQISQMMFYVTQPSAHIRPNIKSRSNLPCICTAYTQQTALILCIPMSIYFVELIPIFDCRLLSWGRAGLVIRASNFVGALEDSTKISLLYRFSRVKSFKSLNLKAIKTALLVYIHSNIFDCK